MPELNPNLSGLAFRLRSMTPDSTAWHKRNRRRTLYMAIACLSMRYEASRRAVCSLSVACLAR